VFCTVANAAYGDLATTEPFASVQEEEGLTIILVQAQADGADLPYNGTFRCITLTVHSSLEAVGLTAVISTKLAQHQISANVIAGFHHDHIFVPADQVESALQALASLTP
jgi:hypothetical protein